MRIAKDRLVNGVAAFLLPVDSLESECRFRNTVDLSDKVPALIVKEILAVGNQELKVTDLWRIDGWVIHLRHAPVIKRVPHAAGS